MKRNDIQIYIMSHHKENYVLDNELFTPIESGSYYNNIPQYKLRDNANIDNISYLNPCFMETTALYYIYKHLVDNYTYIGVNQHRRQFDLKPYTDFHNIFTQYKIICHREKLWQGLQENYNILHNPNDIKTILDIIKQNYPEYTNTIKNINSIRYLYTNDCFITTKEIFKDYCKFFFNIIWKYISINNLFNVNDIMKYGQTIADKKKLDGHKEQKTINGIYQSRIVGYLQERIFTMYMIQNFNQNDILLYDFRNIKEGRYNFQTLL